MIRPGKIQDEPKVSYKVRKQESTNNKQTKTPT